MSSRTQLNAQLADAMQVVIADAVLSNDRIARSIGLNVVDLQTLGVVMRAGAPMTPGELSAATGMPSSSTTRVLDRLQARGYVSRTHDAQDRRRVLVTVDGPRLIAELQAHYIPIVEQMERVHAQFSPDELAVALRYLRAIAAG